MVSLDETKVKRGTLIFVYHALSIILEIESIKLSSFHNNRVHSLRISNASVEYSALRKISILMKALKFINFKK